MEFGITVPNPIYIVTTMKDGDIPNANIQSWSLLCGEIVQIAIDDAVMAVEPEKRIAAMNLMYNIRGTILQN